MAVHSAFEKKYVEHDKMSDVEGLLEHFNLPPKTIVFIRKNIRAIQIAIAALVLAVVAYSMYGSYRDNRIEEAASALSLALELPAEQQAAALQAVSADYSGTEAAIWATVELADNYVVNKKYDDAVKAYKVVAEKVSGSDPLRLLALFGEAQASEAAGQYDDARVVYTKLKAETGYKDLAFLGIARTYEVEEAIDKAIATLNEYLITMDENQPQAKAFIESKVIRLKSEK